MNKRFDETNGINTNLANLEPAAYRDEVQIVILNTDIEITSSLRFLVELEATRNIENYVTGMIKGNAVKINILTF